jgi:hypothetical protein
MFIETTKLTGGKGMRRLVNPKSDRRVRRRKVVREGLPFSLPWWDLSDFKPGLDRKQFVREMAGIQDRLSALVAYLDNLGERSVLVEAWYVLEKLGPARQGRERKDPAAPRH